MYLVIKNGTQKKSYQCTNTCNKPRVCISNSYIPLTNNIQSKPKCKINSMEIASYKSYTYTSNKGTVTTGTTYLTRTETTGTTYQTRASTYNTVYQTAQSYVTGNDRIVLYNESLYGTYSKSETIRNYYFTPPHYCSIGKTALIGDYHQYYVNPVTLSVIYSCSATSIYQESGPTGYYPPETQCNATKLYGTFTGNVSTPGNLYSRSPGYYQTVTTGTSYQTRASTYNTLYGTRASTSGTSYGTKTTNKTLTSSSWG